MANSTLKQKLANNEMVLCGGVWDSLSAIIEEKAGFDAVKLGSSQLNASLGLPDLGLVTAAEVRDRIYNISNHIQIPLIVDFESGFGSERDIASAVYWAGEFERAGATAIHIDDYGDDKCPWLPPYIPEMMSAESVADKIKAICDHRKSDDFLIIVRSGATSSCSFTDKEAAFEESMRRFRMWKEAGADVVWPRCFSDEHLIRYRDELGGFLSQSVASKVGQGRVGAGADGSPLLQRQGVSRAGIQSSDRRSDYADHCHENAGSGFRDHGEERRKRGGDRRHGYAVQ